MVDEQLRKNTVKVVFNVNDSKPKDIDMINFALNLGLTTDDIRVLYQDQFERCIYIKFSGEDIYTGFLRKHENLEHEFKYESGHISKVKIIPATGKLKYVRVFNLPPEIDDKDVVNFFKVYGKVLAFRNEKYGVDFKLPVLSGVRGLSMELEKEIPQYLFFKYNQHSIKIKVYYEGIREKCYKCGLFTHKIADCPLLNETIPSQANKTLQSSNNLVEPQTQATSDPIQYSQVLQQCSLSY